MHVTRVGVMVVVAVAGGGGVNTAFAVVVVGGGGVFGVCSALFSSFPLLLLRQTSLKILPEFRTTTSTVGACYLKFKLQTVVPGIT